MAGYVSILWESWRYSLQGFFRYEEREAFRAYLENNMDLINIDCSVLGDMPLRPMVIRARTSSIFYHPKQNYMIATAGCKWNILGGALKFIGELITQLVSPLAWKRRGFAKDPTVNGVNEWSPAPKRTRARDIVGYLPNVGAYLRVDWEPENTLNTIDTLMCLVYRFVRELIESRNYEDDYGGDPWNLYPFEMLVWCDRIPPSHTEHDDTEEDGTEYDHDRVPALS